jgi:RNA polymerase sigma-70 factor, ECF subfamily
MEPDIEKQFLAAYDDYADDLFRHCYFRVYDRELAIDLVQEVFCRAWAYLARGKEVQNLRAFLYGIMHNVIVDEIKRNKAFSLDSLLEEGFSFEDDTSPDMEQHVIVQEVVGKFRLLDEPYRIVMQMRFVDDLPPKEIARILELSENVVSVRLHRGVEKLRKILNLDNGLEE